MATFEILNIYYRSSSEFITEGCHHTVRNADDTYCRITQVPSLDPYISSRCAPICGSSNPRQPNSINVILKYQSYLRETLEEIALLTSKPLRL
jgi:hypothetical protein